MTTTQARKVWLCAESTYHCEAIERHRRQSRPSADSATRARQAVNRRCAERQVEAFDARALRNRGRSFQRHQLGVAMVASDFGELRVDRALDATARVLGGERDIEERAGSSTDRIVNLVRAGRAGDARLREAFNLLDVAGAADERGEGEVGWYFRAATDPDHRLLRYLPARNRGGRQASESA